MTVLLVLALPGVAAARRAHGAWSNPKGSCVTDLKILDAQGHFRCTGSSRWTGTFRGRTRWRVTGIGNTATGASSGRIREVFRGRVGARGRRGRLRFVERYTQDAAGHITIHGRVVSGTRQLRRVRGRVTWTGTMSATTGVGAGAYHGRWRLVRRAG
jgi:hypothetical protein